MTSPPPVSVTYPVPGTAPVALTDGAGNSPAGCQLINPGLNGGTVWLSAGPTGAASVPLGPGASVQWTDRATLPYARLAAGAAAPEQIVVTSQAQGYSNPITVASALIAQGIPSTYLDSLIGHWQITPGTTVSAISSGQYASLYVSFSTFNYAPGQTPAEVGIQITWLDPNGNPLSKYTLTADDNADGGTITPYRWAVPVLGHAFTLKALVPGSNSNPQFTYDISIVGNNRLATFRQLGAESGVAQIQAANTADTSAHPLTNLAGGSRQTRLNGHVQLGTATQGVAGILYVTWVDESCTRRGFNIFTGTGGDELYDFAHPSVPVSWSYAAKAASAGNGFTLTLIGKS